MDDSFIPYKSVNIKSDYSSKTPTHFLYTKIPDTYTKKTAVPQYISPLERLNTELLTLSQTLKPTPTEIEIRNFLISKFQLLFLEKLNLHCTVMGSYSHNLFLTTSDIDLSISCPTIKSDSNQKKEENILLKKICLILQNTEFIEPISIIHLNKARIPIIKCRDILYKIRFDISINNMSQSRYVHTALQKKPYLHNFCLVLKYFLFKRDMSQTRRGGLCSYAQFLLLNHFFNLHPLIQLKTVNPLLNMGVLFMDFFQYFGIDFKYDRSVMISHKGYYNRIEENNTEYRDEGKGEYISDNKGYNRSDNKGYYNRSDNNNTNFNKFYDKSFDACLNIEDPDDPSYNVGHGCSTIQSVKEVFNHCYRIMSVILSGEVDSNKCVLSVWVNLDEKEEEWRRGIVEKYKEIKGRERGMIEGVIYKDSKGVIYKDSKGVINNGNKKRVLLISTYK
ncbi:putative poly(A) polymerase [Hamiltosporidium tvaerminnensis]|uniref:Putative poly(A) polymerase n=1 Tax=Hamiltosporidium tvaerminnensis TaxID=1176355 RepID=A0A4Q9M620_9MICR|nr:putative poly(A) polymerase [Hamiltosporidium tvaerminnensis]